MKKTSMINEATVSKKVVSDLNYYFGDLKPGSPTHKFAVKEILKSALIDANFSDLANKLDTLISGAKWDEKEQGIPATSAIRLIKRKGEDIAKDSKWDAETIINSVSAYLIKTDTATAKKIQSLKNSINEGIGNWVSNYISELSNHNESAINSDYKYIYKKITQKHPELAGTDNWNLIKSFVDDEINNIEITNTRDILDKFNEYIKKKRKMKAENATPEEENEFHVELDKLVHKTFGKSSHEKKNEVKNIIKNKSKINENQYIGLWDRTFAHLDKVIPNYNSNPIKNFNNVKHAIRVELFKGKITDRMAGNIAMEYELYRNGEKTRKGATNAVVNYLAKFMKKNEYIKEGNAFTGALYNARKEGLQEFEFNGKKYTVYEEKTEEDVLTESKLDFSKVKKGDKLIGKFPPYKEFEVISSNGKNSIIAKDLKSGTSIEINSTNNYKLKESKQNLYKKGDVVNYIPKLSGLNPKTKLKISNAVYDKGDKFTNPGWYYTFDGTNLRANEMDIKPVSSVKESTEEPKIITQLRDVMNSGYKTLKDPKSGKNMKVDSYSASAIVKVYDALKDPKNKEKFSSAGLLGMQSIAFKLMKENNSITEGVWSNIMKGVKKGDSGPWSIVAIQNNKVVAQKINIKTPQIIPAYYEGIKKEHPNALIRIEDGGGMIVWSGK
jgi:hypothetical protein